MSIIFEATQIPGLYSYVTDTEWRACFLPQLNTAPSVTLGESFNQQASIYIFALEAPDLNNQFIQKLYTLLKTNYPFYQQQSDHCFVWLNQGGNPDVIAQYKFAQALIFDDSYSIKKNPVTASQQLWFNNSNYFAVAAYSQVSLNKALDGFTIKRTPISTSYHYGLYLTHVLSTMVPIPLGSMVRNDVKPSLEPPLTILLNSAGSSIQYGISFPLKFDKPQYYQIELDLYPYHGKNLYTIMPTGLKYYFDQKNGITEMTYLLFNNTNILNFQASFHPGAIFSPDYTNFKFESSSPLYTNIPTTYGKLLNIKSTANSLLVFSKSPDDAHTGKSRYYWTLAGDFVLINASPTELSTIQNRLLCGISGTETISFTGENELYEGDIISFTDNQPAYAPVFPILNEQNAKNESPLLIDKFTTAWFSFKKSEPNGSAPIFYHSQPEGAALFNPSEASGILGYAEVPSSKLSEHQNAYFPLASSAVSKPYLGMRKNGEPGYYDQETIRQFEIQILNPARKKSIALANQTVKRLKKKRIQATSAHDANLSTTPQGLLVNLSDDQSSWQSITLANPTVSTDENQIVQPLMFKNIDTDGSETGLQEAFQTNEQFLVISNPVPDHIDFYNTYFQNKIDIAAWPFILDITGQNKWTDKTGFTNIVIFKFCNYSIEERIKNQKLWTDPLNFNKQEKIPALTRWILDYIDTAKQAVATYDGDKNSPFQHFVDIVTNKDWNGILCLQVTIDLTDLPKEIKAILAGIDTSRFTAHHFGIEANHIALTAENKLDANFKSSMFGLINYVNETYESAIQHPVDPPVALPITAGDFDFKVLELQVLFDQSLIKDFKSKIQLSLNALFNEPVVSESNPSKDAINQYSMVMDGLYDKRNGNTGYSFTITDTNTLGLSSVALSHVTVLAVQLATVDETEGADLTSRFYISGNLAFHQLENFDMFSYTSLPFSNLILDMKFNLNNLGSDHTPKKTFSFDPSGVVFSKNNAMARPDSLVPHFPLDLTNLLYHSPATAAKGTPTVTPASLSYIPVDAPLATLALSSSWYALRFNVNLGSMGALTAKIGFNAEILLAWSPGLAGNRAQVFIKMPFSGNKADKGFSLQGILKFAVGSIMFINTAATKEQKTQYAMVFTQIGLSLMGLKLPRSGNTIFYLFGNPDGSIADATNGNLGWYGAYQAEKEKKENLNNIIS
ncbi:hypothetical protein GEO21_11630 [Sphingobacterium faecium]|uniref:hypothetical protein n=1 Tax=Sphingobacterium faecium TaxID=34087 RepID=UPI001292373F|nr:hypothetical protein [Sphingobacterium faecium]MQP28156.1 hypothetical protein [Sphingobacterium faecium]